MGGESRGGPLFLFVRIPVFSAGRNRQSKYQNTNLPCLTPIWHASLNLNIWPTMFIPFFTQHVDNLNIICAKEACQVKKSFSQQVWTREGCLPQPLADTYTKGLPGNGFAQVKERSLIMNAKSASAKRLPISNGVRSYLYLSRSIYYSLFSFLSLSPLLSLEIWAAASLWFCRRQERRREENGSVVGFIHTRIKRDGSGSGAGLFGFPQADVIVWGFSQNVMQSQNRGKVCFCISTYMCVCI